MRQNHRGYGFDNEPNSATIKPELIFTNKQRQAQRELLKKLSELRLTIQQGAQAAGINLDNFNEVLNKHIGTRSCVQGPNGFQSFIWNQKLSIKETLVTPQYAIDILMPKIILLQHFDRLLQPTIKKLSDLEKKKNTENQYNGKYTKAYVVANEIVMAANEARQQLFDSDNIQETLQAIQKSLSDVYTKNNVTILAEHRGNKTINAVLNMINKLGGYVMFALTYPNRYFDDTGTQAYVNSWFEARPTQSFHIFSIFKEKIMDPQVAEELGVKANPVDQAPNPKT